MTALVIGTLLPPGIVALLMYLAWGFAVFATPGAVIVLLFFTLVGFVAAGAAFA